MLHYSENIVNSRKSMKYFFCSFLNCCDQKGSTDILFWEASLLYRKNKKTFWKTHRAAAALIYPLLLFLLFNLNLSISLWSHTRFMICPDEINGIKTAQVWRGRKSTRLYRNNLWNHELHYLWSQHGRIYFSPASLHSIQIKLVTRSTG